MPRSLYDISMIYTNWIEILSLNSSNEVNRVYIKDILKVFFDLQFVQFIISVYWTMYSRHHLLATRLDLNREKEERG